MGGDLIEAPVDRPPGFLVRAVKDPDGANLERVQVVKGWRNGAGDLQEKVYDVALSDDQRPDRNGNVPQVGNTVNVAARLEGSVAGAGEIVIGESTRAALPEGFPVEDLGPFTLKGLQQKVNVYRVPVGELAETVGWSELVEQVEGAVAKLAPEEREGLVIVTETELFGRRRNRKAW